MRRTVFAFPRDLLPAARGSSSARVAKQLSTRLAKEVEANGLADDGAAWVRDTCADVLAQVRERPATTAQLRAALPALDLRLEMSPGKKWGGEFPIAPRLLGTLAADGTVVRGRNDAGLEGLAPVLDRGGGLARRGARGPRRAGGLRGAGRPLARALRPRHRGRHRLVAGFDEGCGASRAGGHRRDRRRARRWQRGVGASGGLREGRCTRTVGRPPPRARPDDDGLEGARLLPRRARLADLRPQRQRRTDRVVERPDRRRLDPDRRRDGGRRADREHPPCGEKAAGGRGRAPHRLARRRCGAHDLPVAARAVGGRINRPHRLCERAGKAARCRTLHAKPLHWPGRSRTSA